MNQTSSAANYQRSSTKQVSTQDIKRQSKPSLPQNGKDAPTQPLDIHLIRTDFGHIASHSGLRRFVQYIDKKHFQIDERAIRSDHDDFLKNSKLPAFIKNRLIQKARGRWVSKNGLYLYKLNDLRAEFNAWGKWNRKGFDILHYLHGEHSFRHLPRFLRNINLRKNSPHIITTYHQPPKLMEKWVRKDILQDLQHVSVIAPNQIDYLTQFIPEERITLIPHGVDTEYYRPDPNKTHTQTLRCMSSGKWLRDYDAILKVAKLLQHEPHIEFHIIARGLELPEELSNVIIHKDVSDEDFLKTFQQSDVLFLPLQDSTANNALLEGIACGLPVVSTQMKSVQYYLPGEEAFLAEDNRPQDLADMLVTLKDDIDLRIHMGQEARKRALTYDWQHIAKQYAHMYHTIAQTN